MEDAATVEISRAQIWQWIYHPKGILDDGRKVTLSLFRQLMSEELIKLQTAPFGQLETTRMLDTAAHILDEIVSSEEFVEFLTLPAYRYLT